MPLPSRLPAYHDLPEVEVLGRTLRSAWGVFGQDDELGTWNLVTPDKVREAAALVRKGAVFNLDLPLNEPDPPLFEFRGAYRQSIEEVSGGLKLAYDDRLDNFFPQTSSQWDGHRHVGIPGSFYNGRSQGDVLRPGNATLGIQNLAAHGIVTRGVLLDVERYLRSKGTTWEPNGSFEFTADDLRATAQAQGVEVRPGDVLLFHTGWLRWLRSEPRATREALAHDLKAPGLRPDGDTAEYLWNLHIAAIATDTVAVERWPIDPARGFLHIQLIALFGMNLGEMWWLQDLADDCAADGVWEFMLVSSPLNIPGGVGSPPNAVAIK